MLRFTSRGVAPDPRCLQVRVASGTGVVRAGIGDPSRAMRDDEVVGALRAFTLGRRGPRVAPCDALVLSGLPAERAPLWEVVRALAPTLGLTRITVHADACDPAACPGADHRVLPLLRAPDPGTRRVLDRVRPDAVVLPLTDGLEVATAWMTALCSLEARPREWVLTWPLDASASPCTADAAVALLDQWVPVVTGLGARIVVKGIPACALGAHHGLLRRSRNRFYVDADHQGDAARLFMPDVLRFARADACRFCGARSRCDGVAASAVEAGVAPALRAIDVA